VPKYPPNPKKKKKKPFSPFQKNGAGEKTPGAA